MDFHHHHHHRTTTTPSPSSSTSSTTTTPKPTITTTTTTTTTSTTTTDSDPMHSWWESISKARTQIHSLSSLLSSPSLSSLADSDRPALSLLSSSSAYSILSHSLSSPSSGSGSDPLCQWLYETYLSSDPHLRLVVLSFLPLISGLYLSRIHSDPSPSLAGFEAVLLAVYAFETKARAGKPVLISIPDLSQPSLYHTPRAKPSTHIPRANVGVLSPPLEPQIAVKSTKRACIVGVALGCYFKEISNMPAWSKAEFCRFAAAWAGQDCVCRREFDEDSGDRIDGFLEIRSFDESDEIKENDNDENGVHDDHDHDDYDDVVEGMGGLGISENYQEKGAVFEGVKIPLPWELLQPCLRILGHCLLAPLNTQEVKDSAAVAVRALYARASHDLVPQAILATRSLIQLDKRAREAAKAADANASANVSSNVTTPSKAKKPEILLVSK